MNGWQILLTAAKLWLVFVLPSAAVGISKLAATNDEEAQRRKLTTENQGFIRIDCGVDEDYVDGVTGILYKSDKDFISTGANQNILDEYANDNPYYGKLLNTLRNFPQGNKNCYTLQPEQGKNHNYLIKAFFHYGNYDSKNHTPEFGLYLGVNNWATVQIDDADRMKYYESIHFSLTDTIYVCLVNGNSGIPFISALELQLLDNSIYTIGPKTALLPLEVNDLGNGTKMDVRFEDDIYGRIWYTYAHSDWNSINTTSDIDVQGSDDPYKVPVEVLRTAAQPKYNLSSLSYTHESFPTDDYYVYFHFAEIVEAAQGQQREFNITLNAETYGPYTLEYLKPQTICPQKVPIRGEVRFSINSTVQSKLPPILNAFEIHTVLPLNILPTDQADVEAIMAIKQAYKINREDWQGDSCRPTVSTWSGLNCSNDSPPRIISLNLSSSKLTGEIDCSLSKLTALQSLDLSNNKLTGTVPEFLAQLPNLSLLNLTGNQLTGSVPQSIMEKFKNGMLQLSLDGNPNPCQTDSCRKKKQNFLLPIIASIFSTLVLLLLSIIAIIWRMKRRVSRKESSSLKSKNRSFTYPEIVSITNNFRNIIGEGGFGTVYLGNLGDGTQVAVKLLSQSSKQGYKQFQAEIQLLMVVHHKNLVPLIGYCDDHENVALVYEYMANGNLLQHLSEKSTNVLNWRERLQIAVDAAYGLEYLHNGCKPPIIHRDLKPSNILLNENMQAKISDFGLSKVFTTETDTHVTTGPSGTPGYVDPEFQSSGNLNKKSDVYSFGVILFELVTGQSVIIRGHEYNTHIIQRTSPLIERGDIHGIVDPRLKGEFDINSAWKVVKIALSCVPPNAIQRPDMTHVLVELKECLDMEMSSGRSQRAWSNSHEMSSLVLGTESVLSASHELLCYASKAFSGMHGYQDT